MSTPLFEKNGSFCKKEDFKRCFLRFFVICKIFVNDEIKLNKEGRGTGARVERCEKPPEGRLYHREEKKKAPALQDIKKAFPAGR